MYGQSKHNQKTMQSSSGRFLSYTIQNFFSGLFSARPECYLKFLISELLRMTMQDSSRRPFRATLQYPPELLCMIIQDNLDPFQKIIQGSKRPFRSSAQDHSEELKKIVQSYYARLFRAFFFCFQRRWQAFSVDRSELLRNSFKNFSGRSYNSSVLTIIQIYSRKPLRPSLEEFKRSFERSFRVPLDELSEIPETLFRDAL